MNTRYPLALIALLSLSLGRPLSAAEPAAGAKFGYNVLLELNIDEKGEAEDGHIVHSDDTTFDHALDSVALAEAKAMKFPVHQKDGHPVKYTARAPFVFPVEGDEGPDSNNAPKPKIHSAIKPLYPAELAAKGEVGGVIVELRVDATGKVAQLQVLRSSHPEFAQATEVAVKQWVFSPPAPNGTPVESRFRMAVSFITDVSVPDWKWRFAPRPSIGSYTVMHATQPVPVAEAKPAAPAPAPTSEPAKK